MRRSGIFGPAQDWPDQDLIAFSAEFDPGLVVEAYRAGVFPMPLHASGFGEMGWWSPTRRGVLPVEGLRVTRSMRQSARRYTTTIDRAFERVLAACSDPSRPNGWIDAEIARVYTALHRAGRVHSVESWDAAGRLVGGLYGVSLGGLFDPIRPSAAASDPRDTFRTGSARARAIISGQRSSRSSVWRRSL